MCMISMKKNSNRSRRLIGKIGQKAADSRGSLFTTTNVNNKHFFRSYSIALFSHPIRFRMTLEIIELSCYRILFEILC